MSDVLLAAVAIVGHVCLCVWIVNRLHATALPYSVIKTFDLFWYSAVFGVPALIAWSLWQGAIPFLQQRSLLRGLAAIYLGVCLVAALLSTRVWWRYLTDALTTDRLAANHTRSIDMVERIGHVPCDSSLTRLAASLPANQVFQLAIQEKTLTLPRLDVRLAGLRIAHLSDLHFTGRVTADYYREIVEETNRLSPDMVVIAGDIIDKRQCLPWLQDILGGLKSRYGTFFVLGNHDLRVRDELGLRRQLVEAGMIDLGGRWQTVQIDAENRRRGSVLLAGNELPWFVPAADLRGVPPADPERPVLKIAVAHSPDQIDWARHFDFDLMLAGHTHGGQICLPLIGPVFSPSRYGVKYAAGTFFEDPTLLHVSRGLSGTRPLRFNCQPELALLILQTDAQVGGDAKALPR